MHERKKYLAVFILPKLEAEHAQITDAVRHHSGGDFTMAFTWAGPKPEVRSVIGFLFTSAHLPTKMGFGLLSQDSYLLVELGEGYAAEHLSVATAWLQKHRAPR